MGTEERLIKSMANELRNQGYNVTIFKTSNWKKRFKEVLHTKWYYKVYKNILRRKK